MRKKNRKWLRTYSSCFWSDWLGFWGSCCVVCIGWHFHNKRSLAVTNLSGCDRQNIHAITSQGLLARFLWSRYKMDEKDEENQFRKCSIWHLSLSVSDFTHSKKKEVFLLVQIQIIFFISKPGSRHVQYHSMIGEFYCSGCTLQKEKACHLPRLLLCPYFTFVRIMSKLTLPALISAPTVTFKKRTLFAKATVLCT